MRLKIKTTKEKGVNHFLLNKDLNHSKITSHYAKRGTIKLIQTNISYGEHLNIEYQV